MPAPGSPGAMQPPTEEQQRQMDEYLKRLAAPGPRSAQRMNDLASHIANPPKAR